MTPQLVIVGGGPLCTYALERLAATLAARQPSSRGFEITVFDAGGRFGAGETHDGRQVQTSYLNRVASQIAFAADESHVDATRLLPSADRPTFFEWSRARFAATGDARFDLTPTSYPHRYLHGLALAEAFAHYVERLRSLRGVTIELRPEEVTDIAPTAHGFKVRGSGSTPVDATAILLVTGHSTNRIAPGSFAARLAEHARRNPPAGFVDSPYPLAARVTEDAVRPGATAGMLGMGLTAVDAILHLTEGRGGRFVRDGDTLRYVASGREPSTIVVTSPSGLFASCRPYNEKATDGSGTNHHVHEHRGVFLTSEAVKMLRANRGRQLDFERDALPLIVLELAFVYHRTRGGAALGRRLHDSLAALYRAFLDGRPTATGHDWIARFLATVDAETGSLADDERFDWRRAFDPLDPEDGTDWRGRLIAYMRRDHEAAARGNLRDPLKAACDGVWRDLRSPLGEIVDFGGLTPASHEIWATRYLRYYSRMSNGTGIEAMSKILALVEDGLVDASIGPRPVIAPIEGQPRFSIVGSVTDTRREVDVIVEGRAHPFDPEHDKRPLYPNLIARGLVRPWAGAAPGHHPVELTRDYHPVTSAGAVEPRITILGAPAEGLAFFQLTAARPRSNGALTNTLARWAEGVITSSLDEAVNAPAHASL